MTDQFDTSYGEYPSEGWFKVNFAGWSTLVNMKFTAQCAQLLMDGMDSGKAVNQQIERTATELLAQGVPTDTVQAFREQYTNQRAMLMECASVWAKPYLEGRKS